MKLLGDQLHCPGFDSLNGQILTGQESRGEISKTRLTLLLTVLKAEGGRQRGAGNAIEAPSSAPSSWLDRSHPRNRIAPAAI